MPSTSTPSREARPATAPSIAIRWSPWESTAPPRRPPVPSTTSRRRSPRPRRRGRVSAAHTVAIRSLSLRRSSSASRIVVSPSAKQAARATSGSSSIASGISAPPTSVPRSSAGRDPQRPARLAASARRPSISTAAPIRSRISSSPVRVGLSPTPVSDTSLPGTSEAATRKKAAEEMSAGTAISPGSQAPGEAGSRPSPPSRSTSAPGGGQHPLAVVAARRPARRRRVSPSASSPANSRHDLTWALATGSS